MSSHRHRSLTKMQLRLKALFGTKKQRIYESKQSLESRLEDVDFAGEMVRHESGHVMTFAPEISNQKLRKEEAEKAHREERRSVRRSAKTLKKDKLPPRFWMGKRVR